MQTNPAPEEEIFSRALDRTDPAERARFLDQACGDDASLRARVEKLLAAHEQAGAFLASADRPNAAAPAEAPGTLIGHYKLLEQIGEGGFGVVFMAEQEFPVRRRVAVKIIKLGMDTKQVVARFEAERQALAMMEHPSIARVFDAGATATGRPYFVMELVRGTPITQYCDQTNLGLAKRLDLFVQTCNAVQHAHQKGIIHRDLKPSNVLVMELDGRPVPKIIDFGVAKATQSRLTDATLFTGFRQIIGTPTYMSPEQAGMGGIDIDTRSDIYSLGVLLYELLTGTTPFDTTQLMSAAYEEMQRIIREVDPPRPSTRLSTLDVLPTVAARRQLEPRKLIHHVHGELDWIVMRALEKDRARRYPTANELAADVQRYLADEPVNAAAPSRIYRLGKFIRRNKRPVIAGGAILLVLIAGVIGTTIGLIGQARQREQAQEQAAIANAVREFQSEMLASANPDRMLGDKVTVADVMRSAVHELDGGKLKDQPLVETEIRITIGRTLQALGRYDEAETQLRRALEMRRKIPPARHADIGPAITALALLLRDKGNATEAEPLFREVITLDRAAAPGPDSEVDLAYALNNLALLLRDGGRYGEAEPLFRESLSILRRVLPVDDQAIAQVAQNLAGLLQLLEDPVKLEEAERLGREAVKMRLRTLPPGHPKIAESLSALSRTLYERGQLDESEKLCREALDLRLKVLPAGHPDLGESYSNLANLLKQQGRFTEAEAPSRSALKVARAVYPEKHHNVALSLDNLGELLSELGRYQEAEKLFGEALEIRRAIRPPGHPVIAVSLDNLATVLDVQGKLEAAEPLYQEALEISRAALPPDHPELARNRANLGRLLLARGKFADAEPLFRDALSALQKHTTNDDWRLGVTRMGLGRALIGLHRLPEAETELLDAERVLASQGAGRKNYYYNCANALAGLYTAWETAEPGKGYDAKAAQWRAKLPTTSPATTRSIASR